MTTPYPNTNPSLAMTAAADHARKAGEYSQMADRATARLVSLTHNIAAVYGDALGHVLERAIEDVTEAGSEARYHYDQEVDSRGDRILSLNREIEQLTGLLATAVEETRKRYVRARKPLPDWVDHARYAVLRNA